MSDLISCQSLAKSFGTRLLFEGLTFSIYEGDRIGLIGLNGCGKSTLLKILAGQDTPDSGTVVKKRGIKVGYLPQECEFSDKSPKQILLETLDDESTAEMWLSKLGFTGDEPSAALLSGGWKKRLGLARELILSPDLLLLDEPTNHLDLNGILLLEQFLDREAPPYLLVSHDRYFLQNACSRVLEIDPMYPRGIFAVDGPYSDFLEKKEIFIEGQLQQERRVATKMRRETEWLRQGVKARTTKSRSRIDKAHEIIKTHSQIKARNRKDTTKIDFEASERETQKLISINNLSKEQGGKLLFHHLDFILSPGGRIGLMGPNGSGKTTLLRILAGELAPDVGTVKKVDDLKIVYFDQHRAELPKNISLKEALSPDGDYVLFRGQRIHVNGWCKRFLFSPDILEMPIGKLSGGERARISIARLILSPADILLLDEPTNDLDIPTLEALEESLIDFPGAVVLITHDRCMIDRICNSLIALGEAPEPLFFADLSQWEAFKKQQSQPAKSKEGKVASLSKKEKLTYSEKKEYETIEGKIAKLEEEVSLLNKQLEDPALADDQKALTEVCKTIALAETQIEQLYLRWHALDDKNLQ